MGLNLDFEGPMVDLGRGASFGGEGWESWMLDALHLTRKQFVRDVVQPFVSGTVGCGPRK